MQESIQGVLGICTIMALAWGVGRFHRIDIRKIVILLGVHGLMTWFFLKTPAASHALQGFGRVLESFQKSVLKGTSFVFGYIGGAETPFQVVPGKGSSFILIFQALPMVVVMGAISMILFHTGILPWIVRLLSRVMEKTKIIGGGLATALSGKIFLGQTDSPLLVRPYLEHFSNNELFTLMTACMATSASTIFALYAHALQPIMPIETALLHLTVSALTNIIAALIIAEYMQPQNAGESFTSGTCDNPYNFHSIMQAIGRGATDAWSIMMMIAAMMVASIALVDIFNGAMVQITTFLTGTPWTIQSILGYVFSPLAWCMGFSWSDCTTIGSILAEKTVLNEWVAITTIAQGSYGALSGRTASILVYSLCSFSNLSSIGVQIACLGALAPGRMSTITRLAPRALLASLLAGALSSAVTSMIL